MQTEPIDAEGLEFIRQQVRQEWRTNARDDLRVYVLQDADGQRKSERRVMNRSLAETENQLRAERLKRHEAIVSSARERIAAKQQAADEAWESEMKTRKLLVLPTEDSPKPVMPVALSGLEQSSLDYLENERGFVWTLELD